MITHLFLPTLLTSSVYSFILRCTQEVFSLSRRGCSESSSLITNFYHAYGCPSYRLLRSRLLPGFPSYFPNVHALSRSQALSRHLYRLTSGVLYYTLLYSATVLGVLVGMLLFLTICPLLHCSPECHTAVSSGSDSCLVFRCSLPVSWLFLDPALSRFLALAPSVGGGEGGRRRSRRAVEEGGREGRLVEGGRSEERGRPAKGGRSGRRAAYGSTGAIWTSATDPSVQVSSEGDFANKACESDDQKISDIFRHKGRGLCKNYNHSCEEEDGAGRELD